MAMAVTKCNILITLRKQIAKPVKRKTILSAFFDNNGSYLFNIEKPFMIDANLKSFRSGND